MHRKAWIFAAVLFLACGTIVMAQAGLKANLATDTQHGAINTTSKCAGCHTPHAGVNGNTLLWTNNTAATNYGKYTSPTLDNATTDVVGVTNGNFVPGTPMNNTLLCLTCHDGALAATNSVTLTTTNYGTVGGAITGTVLNIGGDTAKLANDHPVNMSLNPTNDPGLNTVASVTAAGLELYSGGGQTDTVQCGSCHDPHSGPTGTNVPKNSSTGYYLRLANNSSGLCLTCHK